MRSFALLFAALMVVLWPQVSSSHSDSGVRQSPVKIVSAWARPSNSAVGAAYLTLHNNGLKDCKLIHAECDLCQTVELHTHIHEGHIKKMRPVKEIVVPAGQTVVMQPGGLHIMLMGLKQPVHEGDTIALTLVFADQRRQKVEVPVQKLASQVNKADNYSHEASLQTHRHTQNVPSAN